jgi:hypothetical protein
MTELVPLRIIMFTIAFTLVVARRPDALFNAQFYAEDGTVWYADAYNRGAITTLLVPYAGYLTFIQRLGAALSQNFPLMWAPLIFNLIAIVIQILPALFITSSRFSKLIPNIKSRLFLGFLYLALPNSFEIHANLTNTQWHLAVLAYMVVAAKPSNCNMWRCFDILVILLSALSGPYCLLLTPVAVISWWLRRERWSLFLLLGLGTCILIQAKNLFFTTHPAQESVPISLSTAVELLARILAGQIFLGSLLGKNGYAWLISTHLWSNVWVIVTLLYGFIVCLYALSKAPLELRLFIVFATLVLGSALALPIARGIELRAFWGAMQSPGLGQRYYFIPMVAFVTTLVWMVGKQTHRQLRLVAALSLSCMVFGIILDWHHPAFIDFKFKEYANKFIESPKGTKVTIPVNPSGWSMELTKH